MKRLSALAIGLTLTILVGAPALAATRTVTLSVPAMTCPSCPVTLRTTLDRLHGVHVVRTDLTHRFVNVEVTDSHVTDRDLTDATKNVGYPSTVVKNNP